MVPKIKGYTADYIKHKARSIKKAQGLTHIQALEQASIQCGFHSWKNFQKQLKTFDPNIDAPVNIQRNFHPDKDLIGSSSKNPYRNLIVAGVNELLENNKISFLVDEENAGKAGDMDGHFMTKLFGYDSVIIWREISYQELMIAVWWKYDHSKNPQAFLTGNTKENFSDSPLPDRKHYKKFVGAVVHGWLERLTGKHLMGTGREHIGRDYIRQGEKAELEKLPIVRSKGFNSEGEIL